MTPSAAPPVRCHPILLHELRARMRGTRAIWMLLGYLGVLGIVLLIGAPAIWNPAHTINDGPLVLVLLVGTQAVLIALLAPALTCGAISIEREHQTYDLLALTPMTAVSAAASKLVAALAFLALCLVASLPLGITSAAFGAVALGDILQVYLILLVEAAVLGAIGLFWSACVRSTLAATVLTYLTAAGACALSCGIGCLPIAAFLIGLPFFGSFDLLSSLCPFTAGIDVFGQPPFFAGTIPFWIPGTLTGVLLTGLFVTLAAARLSRFTQPRCTLAPVFATGLLTWIMVLLLGGLRSTQAPTRDAPLVLGGCVFLLLAFVAPFAVTPRNCRVPTDDLIRSFLTRWRPLLLWIVLGSAAVEIATVIPSHSPDPDLLAPPAALLVAALTLPFLLAQTSLVLALARWTRSAAAAVIAGLAFAGALCLAPVLFPRVGSDPGGFPWMSIDPFATNPALHHSQLGVPPGPLELSVVQPAAPWLHNPAWLFSALLYLCLAALFWAVVLVGVTPGYSFASRGGRRRKREGAGTTPPWEAAERTSNA